MKFQNILLFFAAATFAFASSVEISDQEDLVPTADQSIESDTEIIDKVQSINEKSDEENVLLSENEKPNDNDEDDDDDVDVASDDKKPEDDDKAEDAVDTPKDDIKDEIEIDEDDDDVVVDTNKKPDDDVDVADHDENVSEEENEEKKPTTPKPAKTEEKPNSNEVPAETKDEVPVAVDEDKGEASDDYGDDNGVDALDAVDAGEASDDYGNDASVDAVDAADTPDAPVKNEIKKTNTKTVRPAAQSEESEEENGSEPVVPYAAGVAGAAFLSSAGIIFWLKKSKRNSIEDAPMGDSPVRMESLV